MMTVLAVTGQDMLKDLAWLFALIVCGLILWLLGRWVFPKLKAPEMVLTVWDVIFVVLAAFILINLVLGFFGHPIVPWR